MPSQIRPSVWRLTKLFSYAVLLLVFDLGVSPTSWGDGVLSTSGTVIGQAQSCMQSGTTAATCSLSSTLDLGGGNSATFGGGASAVAAFGSLGTQASTFTSCAIADLVTSCYNANNGTSVGSASFSDLLTLTGAPASGALAFNVQTAGTSIVTCAGEGAAIVCGLSTAATDLIIPGNNLQGEQTIALSTGTTDRTIFIPFDASSGDQVGVAFTLYSSATCVTFNNTTCSSDTNFINTLTVLGLSVVDANGNVASGATVTADSGTNYNDITGDNGPPTGTPEPSSLMMLGVGLIGLAGLTLKKSM